MRPNVFEGLAIVKFNGTNYKDWLKGVTGLLMANGVWSEASEEVKFNEENKLEAYKLNKEEQKAVGLILATVPDDVYELLMPEKHPYQMIQKMSELYAMKTVNTSFLDRAEFTKSSLRPNESLTGFLDRLLIMRRKLEGTDLVVSDGELIFKLMEQAPKEWDEYFHSWRRQLQREKLVLTEFRSYLQEEEKMRTHLQHKTQSQGEKNGIHGE